MFKSSKSNWHKIPHRALNFFGILGIFENCTHAFFFTRFCTYFVNFSDPACIMDRWSTQLATKPFNPGEVSEAGPPNNTPPPAAVKAKKTKQKNQEKRCKAPRVDVFVTPNFFFNCRHFCFLFSSFRHGSRALSNSPQISHISAHFFLCIPNHLSMRIGLFTVAVLAGRKEVSQRPPPRAAPFARRHRPGAHPLSPRGPRFRNPPPLPQERCCWLLCQSSNAVSKSQDWVDPLAPQ